MGKYPPDLLKGMARRVMQAENSTQSVLAMQLYMAVSQRTGLDIDVVRNRIISIADY